MPTTVRYDTENLFRWSEIWDTTDDETGELLDRFTLYDNYLQNTVYYTNGVRSWMIDSDPSYGPGAGLVRDWSRIETYYDSFGIIVGREITYDDGSTKQENFESGTRTQLTEIDSIDAPGTHAWERIETYYALNGQRVGKETTYDNGVVRQENFENGIRTQVTDIDQSLDGLAKSWVTSESYYDMTGTIVGKQIYYDNGLIRQENFENGVRTQILIDDSVGATPEGVKSFTTQEIYFDVTGQKLGVQTIYDDGVQKDESFENGVRFQTVEADVTGTAKLWDQIETTYTQNGLLAGRQTIYDDGTVRTEDFLDGVREQTIQSDNSVGNAAKDWTQITTDFDAVGVIVSRQTDYDDGRQRLDTYDNGERQMIVVNDFSSGNTYSWSQLVTVFDEDGNLDARQRINDDGDELITKYELDRDRDFTIEIDNDESESWAVRVKEFDSNGQNPVVTIYDSQAEVPQPYFEYLGLVLA